ncbi:hypothetical protein ONZ45_g12451 [Pleurotus djamor]|nr:hypothetical protein ONZ45_g12451 [Pleurotus djamor]
MLNVFVGFEQSNKYTISNEHGTPLGYIAEEPGGFLKTFSRQMLATHRPFRALVMDLAGSPILWVRRPFAWINSRINAGTPGADATIYFYDKAIIGSYPPPPIRNRNPVLLCSTRHFKSTRGFSPGTSNYLTGEHKRLPMYTGRFGGSDARSLFTDTGEFWLHMLPLLPRLLIYRHHLGQYFVRFGANPEEHDSSNQSPSTSTPTIIRDLTLDERALILALAINIDCDYFSRHSGHHGGLFGFTHIGGNWE